MILRLVAASLVGVALLVAGPAADAVAQEKKAAQSKAGIKDCRAKGPGGKVLTWKCQAGQPCCYNATTNQGVCGSTVLGCF